MWPFMKFMVAFDNWILYHYLRLVNFPFFYRISTRLKKNPLVNYSSKELYFLHNNIIFLTNLSVDHTDLQFEIPKLI